jgi:hypothetical protein
MKVALGYDLLAQQLRLIYMQEAGVVNHRLQKHHLRGVQHFATLKNSTDTSQDGPHYTQHTDWAMDLRVC